MSQPLLVPLDGSTHAEVVLPWAVHLARVRNWQIHLAQAAALPTLPSAGMLGEEMTPEVYDQVLSAETDGAKEYLEGVRQRLLAELPDVQIVVRLGQVEDVILDLADELGAAAIVMASHVHGGFMRALLGSVAEQIAHHATVPVLVVRASGDQPAPPPSFGRILVPLDGSVLSERALDLASDLIPEAGTLLLVRAEQPVEQAVPGSDIMILVENREATAEVVTEDQDYLSRIVAERSRAGLTVVPTATVDGASDAILKVAREQHADLIVMSSHVHGGVSRLFLGSVADHVLRHAEVPVLLVSARALAAQVVGQALVRDVMTRDLTTVGADESLIVAIRKLLRRRVSGAPVVDADGALVGVLSEADLLEWQSKLAETLIAEGALEASEYARRLATETVRSVMAHPATTVPETASVLEVIGLFRDRGLGRLPVVSEGKLVGIVTRSDVLWTMLRQSAISSGVPEPSAPLAP
jgi:nucleotide-binding universal stress UspA family protein/predicted transcriptional regulator